MSTATARPGPTPRPRLLKIAEGNVGHRTKAELAPGLKLPPTAPDEPDWSVIFIASEVGDKRTANAEMRKLQKEASAIWQRVVKVLNAQGLLSDLDWAVLEDACVVIPRLHECERAISRYGLLVQTERGLVKNGAITAATQYRTQLRYLVAQLGLSPVARDFITPDAGEGADDGDAVFD